MELDPLDRPPPGTRGFLPEPPVQWSDDSMLRALAPVICFVVSLSFVSPFLPGSGAVGVALIATAATTWLCLRGRLPEISHPYLFTASASIVMALIFWT